MGVTYQIASVKSNSMIKAATSYAGRPASGPPLTKHVMRTEIERLIRLGPFPPESEASLEFLREMEELIASIKKPVTNEEAKTLISLFEPPDSCYGLAWSVLHLIETAPSWPISNCLENPKNEWVLSLCERAIRGGLL